MPKVGCELTLEAIGVRTLDATGIRTLEATGVRTLESMCLDVPLGQPTVFVLEDGGTAFVLEDGITVMILG